MITRRVENSTENLLSHRLRRKQLAREEAKPEYLEVTDASQSPPLKMSEASLPSSSEDLLQEQSRPEVVLTDEGMPPIESLTENSDFNGFMSRGVSDE